MREFFAGVATAAAIISIITLSLLTRANDRIDHLESLIATIQAERP